MRIFKGRFRRPTEADIKFLVEHMREDDRRELKRWTGQDAEYEVRHSIKFSQKCYAADFEDGSLACIFGACRANLIEEEAVIWMLSTTNVDTHPMEFYLGSKAGLNILCKAMPDVASFYNWVDLGYVKACNWLEHLGFDYSMKVHNRVGFRGGEFRHYYNLNPCYKTEE